MVEEETAVPAQGGDVDNRSRDGGDIKGGKRRGNPALQCGAGQQKHARGPRGATAKTFEGPV